MSTRLAIGAMLLTISWAAMAGPADLIGEWVAPCDAWGRAASCELTFEPGVHASQVVVRYAIKDANSDEPIFTGHGLYFEEAGKIAGYWADSQGSVHPLASSWQEDALMTHWGKPGGRQGRTEYKLNHEDEMRVIDWALSEQGWQEFMRVTYERQ